MMKFASLFYYSVYFYYYSWVLLHFLILFMGFIVLFQLRERLNWAESGWKWSYVFVLFFFFLVPAALFDQVKRVQMHCLWVLQILLFSHFFIKNGSHSTIYTFKNYFAIVFLVLVKISSIQTNPNFYLYL